MLRMQLPIGRDLRLNYTDGGTILPIAGPRGTVDDVVQNLLRHARRAIGAKALDVLVSLYPG